jgi:hypothetical protein
MSDDPDLNLAVPSMAAASVVASSVGDLNRTLLDLDPPAPSMPIAAMGDGANLPRATARAPCRCGIWSRH